MKVVHMGQKIQEVVEEHQDQPGVEHMVLDLEAAVVVEQMALALDLVVDMVFHRVLVGQAVAVVPHKGLAVAVVPHKGPAVRGPKKAVVVVV